MISLLSHLSGNDGSAPFRSKPKAQASQPSLGLSLRRNIDHVLSTIQETTYNLYLITLDDTPTFVIPNTIFGISSALTPSFILSTPTIYLFQQPATFILYSILQSVIYNWTNLLIFDLANQRSSGDEDLLNKPWRPIPSKRMSETQMKRWLVVAIPIVLAYNHLILGAGIETCLLIILTWIYNDLGGGDDNWILRNWVISCAFGFYNFGSFKVAAAASSHLLPGSGARSAEFAASNSGLIWTVMISAVIFTTMHVQDLKDIAGDRARGRRTAPIIYGRTVAGWTVAIPVVIWSVVCVWCYRLPKPLLWLPIALGLLVAWRCVTLNEKGADRKTWQLWCFWTAVLYIIPPLSI